MFKMIKTTSITALAALALTAGVSTQANAQSFVQFTGQNFGHSTQFNSSRRNFQGGFVNNRVRFNGNRGFNNRFVGNRGFNRGFNSGISIGINNGFNRGFGNRSFNSFGFNSGFNNFGFNSGFVGNGFKSRGFSGRSGFNRGFTSNRGFGVNRGQRYSSFRRGF